ncbi:MAG: hypothetical protein BWK76_02030 [Desulfobulbaceae bacterium A2]|nr:MAG: hypothetical protein BWK76_02030 [Desulfobulbaceae bacterium A2]
MSRHDSFLAVRWVVLLLALLLGPQSLASAQMDSGWLMTEAARYYNGVGRAVNYEMALRLYRQVAETGDAQAQYIAGGMYFRGIGTTRDEREAFKWLLQAAEGGKATDLSQYILGYTYFMGELVPKNYAEARRWYGLAAAAGHRQAKNDLAFMHYNGFGGSRDFARALALYESAALQGDAQAQYNLGIMHASGSGIELDRVKGYAWYSLAASQGNSGAISARNAMVGDMSRDELARAQALSVDLFRRVEELNPPPAPAATSETAAEAGEVLQPSPLEAQP